VVLKIFQQLHFSSVFIFICLIETCHHINIYSNNDTVCSFLSHFRYCIVAMKVYKFLCTPSFCQCWSGAMCWFWFCFFNSKCENVVDPAVQQAEYRICERCDCQWQRRNTTTIKVPSVNIDLLNTVQSIIVTNTCLTASFPGQPGYASTRKVKPFWI